MYIILYYTLLDYFIPLLSVALKGSYSALKVTGKIPVPVIPVVPPAGSQPSRLFKLPSISLGSPLSKLSSKLTFELPL